MRKGVVSASIAAVIIGGMSATAALAQWVPGSEIVGQSVQVETNGVVNTVSFDPGGAARITSPGGSVVQGTWTAANGQLCIGANGGQECWPYQAAFQPGQQVTLTSNCNATSRWLATSTNQQMPRGERG
jgi:hypothetical protein